MRIKVKVYYGGTHACELHHLKPRRYMLGWDFKQLLKYVSKELYWNDLEENDIETIELYDDSEYWFVCVNR